MSDTDDQKESPAEAPINVDSENTQENSALTELEQKLAESEKKFLYLRAEFDNFRRQSIKERSDLVKFGGERLAKDLLDTLDIFETALNSDSTSNFDEFLKGIKLTYQQLKSSLEKHSIIAVESLGGPFDPNLHEALGVEVSDAVPEGNISKVFKKPYKYHDKVLRPGQVILAKSK